MNWGERAAQETTVLAAGRVSEDTFLKEKENHQDLETGWLVAR